MSYTAAQLLAVAAAEVGYREKATNQNLDAATAANDGAGNYTKYARDLSAAGYYNGNKNGFAWCCVFVDWCHYMAAGKDKAEAQRVTCQSGNLGAVCSYAAGYYRSAGRLDTNPQPGDQVFFGDAGSAYAHTGIVEKVDADSIYTIEGNSNNAVRRCQYARGSAWVQAFGHPLYADGDAAEPAQDDASAASDSQTAAATAAAAQAAVKSAAGSAAGTASNTAAQTTAAAASASKTAASTAAASKTATASNLKKTTTVKLYILRMGSRGTAVQSLQLLLNHRRADTLEVDGSFGRLTQQAVLAFQRENNLEADGVVGTCTWQTLLTAG